MYVCVMLFVVCFCLYVEVRYVCLYVCIMYVCLCVEYGRYVCLHVRMCVCMYVCMYGMYVCMDTLDFSWLLGGRLTVNFFVFFASLIAYQKKKLKKFHNVYICLVEKFTFP